MKRILTIQNAKTILLLILGLLIGYHLLIIIGIIPASFVWGNDYDEASIMPLELIAIVLNVSFGLFVLIKMRYFQNGQKSKFIPIAFWLIAVLLLGTSISYLFSNPSLKSFIFSPIKLLLAFLTIRLAIEN